MKNTFKIVYLSTFPPRECGIATFTADLTHALDTLLESVIESKIAAVNADEVSRYHYPKNVIFQIDQTCEQDYIKTAEKINEMDDVKLVNIQHEFGIFGGNFGSHVISFLNTLKKPSVVSFHSVLPLPNSQLREVVCSIAEKATSLVAMTNTSKDILIRDYGIKEEKISMIPHGIHPVTYSRPGLKPNTSWGFVNKRINLLTFGFLNKGKGLEYVIEALPKVIDKYPDFVYRILGVTHPNILKKEGETYRKFLIHKVRELKLSSHVNFYNKYFSLDKLLQFLKATDIYISTCLDPNQAVSGTLSYALGSGRPVISTPFAQAKEFVTRETGLLVEFKDSDSYAEAIIKLLKDPIWREQLGRSAYFRTRNMIWENVALEYLKLFSKYSADIAEVSEYKKLPRINLTHLFRMTDYFGMIQFAKLSFPDISSGYTLDDNARALIVACLCYQKFSEEHKLFYRSKQKRELLKRIEIYLRFIEFVLSDEGVFHNYVTSDRSIDFELNKKENLEDANGRALWALAVVFTTDSLPDDIKSKAHVLLSRRIKKYEIFESPRAIAFCVKGLSAILKKTKEIAGKNLEKMLSAHCDKLVSLYREVSSEDWQWFEEYLTYSNGILPEALILGYEYTKNAEYMDLGVKTLSFLVSHTFMSGIYTPIGQDGWHRKTGIRRYFDQQPEDVLAMTRALATAYSLTREDSYRKLMHEAFNWFLGDNSLKQVVYDRTTGGCYDGVGDRNINLNQGAESTISYLLAWLAVMEQENNQK